MHELKASCIFERSLFDYMRTTAENLLSKRELGILKLIAKGFTSEQIGAMLSISVLTVQTHRKNMLRKTGVVNTHQLVSWGFRKKILK